MKKQFTEAEANLIVKRLMNEKLTAKESNDFESLIQKYPILKRIKEENTLLLKAFTIADKRRGIRESWEKLKPTLRLVD